MKIKRIDLAWVSVSDGAKAKKFFGETLGLTQTVDTPEYNWSEFSGNEGGSLLGVAHMTSSDPAMHDAPGSNAVVTFTVDDILESKKELQTKGVTIIGDIIEVPGHVKMLTFADFDDNVFQLVENIGEETSSHGGECC